MDAKKQQYAGYLDIISKAAKRKVVGANIDLREDVVQEAFMKVIRSDFFSNHDIKNPDNIKVITSYIYLAIKSCLFDELQKQGRLRRSWLSEKEMGEKSYISIESSEVGEDDFLSNITPEHNTLAEQAYRYIKDCFNACIDKITTLERVKFFEKAFWEIESYAVNLKELAVAMGYNGANPTQEINRFIEKINLCVQPHGILVSGLEDIRFVCEYIEPEKG